MLQTTAAARMEWKLLTLVCAFAAATVLAPCTAGGRLEATTVLSMEASELADQADLIFTGTAVQEETAPTKDGRFPFTFITFTVGDVLKGRVQGKQITLRFDGGVLGDRGVEVDGMPRFAQGESYLLFVRGNGSVSCPVLGWWQGQLHFRQEALSNRRILVDSAGTAVAGIAQGRFTRRPAAGSRLAAEADGEITVLSEEGVHIVLSEPAVQALTPLPDAAQVVAQLRSLIAGRGREKSFRPGRLVPSARIEDVPAERAGAAALPRLEIAAEGKEVRP